jgi:hypothetical protein
MATANRPRRPVRRCGTVPKPGNKNLLHPPFHTFVLPVLIGDFSERFSIVLDVNINHSLTVV